MADRAAQGGQAVKGVTAGRAGRVRAARPTAAAPTMGPRVRKVEVAHKGLKDRRVRRDKFGDRARGTLRA